MAKLGDWKEPQSDGTLPLEGSAFEFQYRYAVDWLFSSSRFGPGIGFGDLSGDWTIQIKSGETVLFEQSVTLVVTVVTLVDSFFGQSVLSLFTWFFSHETITTPMIDGAATGPSNPSWSHTIGNTSFSEFGTMEKGGGSDYTNDEGHVSDWWDSPVYIMSVPEGAKLHVVHAGASGGTVPRNLLFEFRFSEADNTVAMLDRQGAIRALEPIQNKLYITHTYKGPQARLRRDAISGTSTPGAIWKDNTNRLFIMAQLKTDWLVWFSDTEGMDVFPLMSGGNQVAIWTGADWKDVDVRAAKRGIYSCARLDGDVYFLRTTDLSMPGQIKKVGPASTSPMVILVHENEDGQDRIEITDVVGPLQYESNDGGTQWTPIP